MDADDHPEPRRISGDEARSHLAGERTLLAWWRSGLAALAVSLAVGRVIPALIDGSKGWYVETDPVNPLNVYGETKAEAERIVLQNPRHSVIRVALNAGTSPTGDRSFVEDMRNSVKGGTLLTLFTDEFRCPLPAGMTARALWGLIDQDRPGLYHLGGAERLSRWEIGQALTSWYPELAGQIQPGSVRTYTGGPRPPDLSMRCDKLQTLLSFPLSGLRAWLAGRTSAGQDLWDYPERSL